MLCLLKGHNIVWLFRKSHILYCDFYKSHTEGRHKMSDRVSPSDVFMNLIQKSHKYDFTLHHSVILPVKLLLFIEMPFLYL